MFSKFYPFILLLLQVDWSTSLLQQCDTPDEWSVSAGSSGYNKWPAGVVKYKLDSSLTANDIGEVQKAFDEYHSKTCVRFEPRSADDTSYTNIQRDDTVCGVAHVCQTGGEQSAKFGGACADATTMIHELGHTLCFGHEQIRPDRDFYLKFNDCPVEDIPPKLPSGPVDSHFYDYTSQMHYQCGSCPGGWPTESGVSRCGRDAQLGLSVLDADKVNDFYECQGCYSHRWRLATNLTENDDQNTPVFGTYGGRPFTLCRAFFKNGEMSPGTYLLGSGNSMCFVEGNGGTQGVIGTSVQVLTIPGMAEGRNPYLWYKVGEGSPVSSYNSQIFTSVGSTNTGLTVYAVRANFTANGETVSRLGKLYSDDMTSAIVAFNRRVYTLTEFEILGCAE